MAKKKSKAKPSKTSKPQSNGAGTLKELKEVYEFMQSNSLHSVELDRKDFRIRLVRKSAAPVAVPVPVAIGAPMASAPASTAPAAAPVPAAEPISGRIVKAPMMGIFYRAASPSSPPFCKEGDTVKKGDVICLIEAMKVFNDIKTDVGGVVTRVLVEDGKSVKVGQDLYVIEPK